MCLFDDDDDGNVDYDGDVSNFPLPSIRRPPAVTGWLFLHAECAPVVALPPCVKFHTSARCPPFISLSPFVLLLRVTHEYMYARI